MKEIQTNKNNKNKIKIKEGVRTLTKTLSHAEETKKADETKI